MKRRNKLSKRYGHASGATSAWVITIRDGDFVSLGDVYRDKESARAFAKRLQKSHPGVQYGVRPITVPARQVRKWHPGENRRSRRDGP